MWRRERGASEVLRIGRHAVERWSAADSMLSLQSAVPLAQDVPLQFEHVAEAIRSSYFGQSPTLATAVIESAWLPVVLVDTGGALLRRAQLDALVRHRLALDHSDATEPVASWDLRIEHRVGSRYALAFGMPSRLKQLLTGVARETGLTWNALTPALPWGLDRLSSVKAWSHPTGWWAWPEQDRTLLCRVVANEWIGLDAGAELATDDAVLLRLVDAEACRFGIESDSIPIAAATWGSSAQLACDDERVTWFGVREKGNVLRASPKRHSSRTTA